MKCSALVVLFSCVSTAASIDSRIITQTLTATIPEVRPSLEPKSDEKFFKHDYPIDNSPKGDAGKFSPPYPKLQSNNKFENDYIKDDNNDGGHWKAQMAYDEIKMKVVKQKEELEAALVKEQTARKDFATAADVGKSTRAQSDAAESAASKAFEEATAAETKVQQAENAAERDAAKKLQNMAAAEQRMEQARANLQGCQDKVDKARKAWEALRAKDAKTVDKLSQAERERIDATRVRAEAAEQKAQSARDKAAQEKREHDAAQKAFENEKAEVDKLKVDLEKSEERLRQLRGEKAKAHAATEDAEEVAKKGLDENEQGRHKLRAQGNASRQSLWLLAAVSFLWSFVSI